MREQVDCALRGLGGLADVNEFGRLWSNIICKPNRLPRVAMKHELEQSLKVATDAPARDKERGLEFLLEHLLRVKMNIEEYGWSGMTIERLALVRV